MQDRLMSVPQGKRNTADLLLCEIAQQIVEEGFAANRSHAFRQVADNATEART
jgi:hypothetical protein